MRERLPHHPSGGAAREPHRAHHPNSTNTLRPYATSQCDLHNPATYGYECGPNFGRGKLGSVAPGSHFAAVYTAALWRSGSVALGERAHWIGHGWGANGAGNCRALVGTHDREWRDARHREGLLPQCNGCPAWRKRYWSSEVCLSGAPAPITR